MAPINTGFSLEHVIMNRTPVRGKAAIIADGNGIIFHGNEKRDIVQSRLYSMVVMVTRDYDCSVTVSDRDGNTYSAEKLTKNLAQQFVQWGKEHFRNQKDNTQKYEFVNY